MYLPDQVILAFGCPHDIFSFLRPLQQLKVDQAIEDCPRPIPGETVFRFRSNDNVPRFVVQNPVSLGFQFLVGSLEDGYHAFTIDQPLAIGPGGVDTLEPLVDHGVVSIPIQIDFVVAAFDRLHPALFSAQPLGLHESAGNIDGQRLVRVELPGRLVAGVPHFEHQAELREGAIELRPGQFNGLRFSGNVLAHPVPLDHDILRPALDFLGCHSEHVAGAQ